LAPSPSKGTLMNLIPQMTQEQMQEAIVEAHMELEELRQTMLKFVDVTETSMNKLFNIVERLNTRMGKFSS